jgi:hypothetical protein
MGFDLFQSWQSDFDKKPVVAEPPQDTPTLFAINFERVTVEPDL